ncbi:F-box only protein 31-like [Amphiura filiformis]|uniref:F-box only protein 31-like n=1 Tax=Amphiura filiformis TaxID=82378 RepID=UPI003B218FB2
MVSILSLPPELLSSVFSELPGVDLARIALVCQQFHAATKIESVWQRRCFEEYNFTSDQLKGWPEESYRTVYTKVLHPYGHILGTWQPQMGPYGGLVSIRVQDGMLVAIQYLPPVDPKVCLPLRSRQLFHIRINEDKQTIVECLKGPNGPHKLQVLPGNGDAESEDNFSVLCSKPDKHRLFESRQEELQNWIREEVGLEGHANLQHNFPNMHDHHIELLRIKYIILNQYDSSCLFKRLPTPVDNSDVPFKAGFFKGTYGGHGIEIVSVTYQDNKLLGTKITGDPNVPARQLSIEAHLDEPMILTKTQQETLGNIEGLQKDDVLVKDPKLLAHSQSFAVPYGVHDRGMGEVASQIGLQLDRCKRRYFATGLIAMHGFRNSSRTPCHLVVFSEDVFALLWLELHSISWFHRVTELL